MTIEIHVPDIGTNTAEVTEILVQIGDKVTVDQSILTVETEKASIEIPSPLAGTVKEITVKIGDQISPGMLVMFFNAENIPTSDMLDITENQDMMPSSLIMSTKCIHATPLIRRLARELSIDLSKIEGSGTKNRILKEDIENYVKNMLQYHETTGEDRKSPSEHILLQKINYNNFGETQEIKLSRIQKLSGNNLYRNWTTIPHVTHFDKTDITELEIFRNNQNDLATKTKLDVKITLVAFIMKSVSLALEKMPRFNSSLSSDNTTLVLKKYINIGVAVDTTNGLVVPVFKAVKTKGILQIAHELTEVATRARLNKLAPSDMHGGCFTISSLGGLGTTYFTPIINAPEVAILGISKAQIEPVWNGKKFIPRLMMPISLSFDHRVIDGAEGARFITIIKNTMADIRCLVM
ncbi:Dihydrolipoyllysine-residue acetyltransferase component of pyruvate dehydrogenase complex [Candidatus Erwinia haradaeae]|uniref:Dihydrolipoamide acetyltransferase component of pyruvate dehydrogenase complex n=1 Tax=Candidatus Erwinia haradaeae TaxID=1922217 RepID=A0A451D836_9GAMM|nr:2-oxo acid dehydrogenase subunit E2 [Candidatus Erwinia haradaeae]VFP81978.1 Dihydrolipoyllysine-residue acetyltransferase component of pyruvate dehydrogenase complex [Candidatus Erwinia haradaeae]